MSRLDHPNVVQVFGGCMMPPVLFMVSELMVGDLSSHLHGKRRKPLPLYAALCIAMDVIKGLVGSWGGQLRLAWHSVHLLGKLDLRRVGRIF